MVSIGGISLGLKHMCVGLYVCDNAVDVSDFVIMRLIICATLNHITTYVHRLTSLFIFYKGT